MVDPSSVSTDGGAAVGGHVNSGTFIGRDQITVISGYSQEQLEEVLNRVVPILRDRNSRVRMADASGSSILTLSADATEAVISLEAAAALSSISANDEATYLASLLVNPILRRWATRFVPLSGTVAVVEDPSGMLEVHPEFSILHARGQGAGRRVFRERVSDITTIAERYDTFIILGDPGAGKSTVLRKLVLIAAENRLQRNLGPLPLMVSLADYRNYRDPYTFLVDQARQKLGDSVSVRDLLARGDLLLLVDSLNELPRVDDRDYRDKVRDWREFVRQWPGNRFVFVCRDRDYSEPLGFQQVEVDPLDDARVRLFLEKYLGMESAEVFWVRLTVGNDDLVSLARNPYLLTMLTTIYMAEGDLPTNRALLFTSFIDVLFSREAEKGHPGWLPQSVLYSALARLAWRMLASGEGTRLPYSEMVNLLRADPEVLSSERQGMRRSGDGFAPSDLIIQLGLATSLLESYRSVKGEEEIYFYHHLLQEAMAAREMLRRWEDGEDLTPQFRMPRLVSEMPDAGPLGLSEPLPPPPSNGWEETTVLAAGLASDSASFISYVRTVNPVLAARCLVEAGVPAGGSLRHELQRDLAEELDSTNVHLRARVAAGNALGRLGDARLERVTVDGRTIVIGPVVSARASSARLGSPNRVARQLSRRGMKYAADEQPQHRVNLRTYRIGRFPVTNIEFGCFVEDDGYEKVRFWTEAGRAWLDGGNPGGGPEAEFLNLRRHLGADPSTLRRWTQDPNASKEIAGWRALISESDERALSELVAYYAQRSRRRPAFWADERYGWPNHPVVGVTWYEAAAYCAWLTERLRLSGRLSAAEVARLPTEAEWEHASRGKHQRTYTWGWKWNPTLANTREGQILAPTPVGSYPETISPVGCQDMPGNVWEWTHSLHLPFPYDASDGRENPDDQRYRVVRGSSWIDPGMYARSAYRGRHPPDFFDYDQGFRIAIGISHSS